MNLIIRFSKIILTNLFSIIISIINSKNFFVKNKISIEEKNINDCKNICLLFIYDKPKIFTNHLIIALKKLNFKIILIINKNKKSNYNLEEEHVKLSDILIYRENYGRDFGAYKDGIKYLKSKNFFNASNFLILNNTFIINPKQIFNFLERFINESIGFDVNSPFISKMGNQFHFQSFFIFMRNKIFLDKHFLEFWEKYKPFSSRYYTIKKGELFFSNMLLRYKCNKEITYPTCDLNLDQVNLKDYQIKELYINSAIKIKDFNPSVHSFVNFYYIKKIPILKISLTENSLFYFIIYPELKRIFLENNIDLKILNKTFDLDLKKTLIYKFKKIFQII